MFYSDLPRRSAPSPSLQPKWEDREEKQAANVVDLTQDEPDFLIIDDDSDLSEVEENLIDASVTSCLLQMPLC